MTQREIDAMESWERQHYEKIRGLIPDCMVLLKKDGQFPLEKPGDIALYGSGARHTVTGGTGSGSVNVRCFTNLEEGLLRAGFRITTKDWLDGYDGLRYRAHQAFAQKHRKEIDRQVQQNPGLSPFLLAMGLTMPEPEYQLPLDGSGDTAVYVLSRLSGEGADRSREKGDFSLSDTEIRDILRCCRQYQKFMLVLNVGGPVDLTPVVDAVPNILLLSQLGMAVGDGFADVLLGRKAPSGKLTATWAAWEHYCGLGDFGLPEDVRYTEGIYVGYRWFEAADVKPLFPFGFGLSYTSFSWKATGVEREGCRVRVCVQVKNCGARAGRETVQLYLSVPAGTLDQPRKVLASFKKTGVLEPGQQEMLRLELELPQMASFDQERNAWILEAGSYQLLIGIDSRQTEPVAAVLLREEVVLQKLQPVGGQPDFRDWKPSGKMPEAESLLCLEMPAECFEKPEKHRREQRQPELLQELTDRELALLCVGNFRADGENCVIGNGSIGLAGAAGETTDRFLNRGLRKLILADGPAGIRIASHCGRDGQGVWALEDPTFESLRPLLPRWYAEREDEKRAKQRRTGETFTQFCSAIPIGTALAQSWDEALCLEMGKVIGTEMARYGIDLWLAPALNIQRNPLCGRNFEYYSEDPLLSGTIAAAVTKGVQSIPGRAVTLKHFACNNQETNRMGSNSMVSPRALREIYLKGFQIAVQTGKPGAIMTSYNLLNGVHTSDRWDLVTGLLREEWDFRGIVMTDWLPGAGDTAPGKYPYATAAGAILAGHNLIMPGGQAELEQILEAVAEGTISRQQLLLCASAVAAAAEQQPDACI